MFSLSRRVLRRLELTPLFPVNTVQSNAAFRMFATGVARSLQSGSVILVHSGETTGRSSMLLIATLCVLGQPLSEAVKTLADFGFGHGNRAQWFVLSSLYGVSAENLTPSGAASAPAVMHSL